jgi:hypothetical protein
VTAEHGVFLFLCAAGLIWSVVMFVSGVAELLRDRRFRKDPWVPDDRRDYIDTTGKWL